MADVFISYKREDRDRIAPLAQALEARGYTVWWDLELVPGQKFERQIKRELDTAKCVIVAWTARSINEEKMYASEWIQNEANSADHRNILIPVLLDAGQLHWRHSQGQFANLVDWDGDAVHAGFAGLIAGIAALVGARERPEDVELAAWTAAERAETAAAFRDFLVAHPHSRFAGIATSRIAELDEASAWNELGPAPTIASLAGFLRRWPAGRFADDAEARIKAQELAAARPPALEPIPAATPTPAAATAPAASRAPAATFKQRAPQPPARPRRLPFPLWLVAAGCATLLLAGLLVLWQRSGTSPLADATAEAPAEYQPATPVRMRDQADGAPFHECADCPTMVAIPAGAFSIGSPDDETARGSDEGPQTQVRIARFALSQNEVTFDQWAACVAGGGCTSNPNPPDEGWGRGDRPVIHVSWHDANAYAAWLSNRTGQDYRLPSEAEWEYAARAGASTRYAWGDQAPVCDTAARNGANFGPCADKRTKPVGAFAQAVNAFGLYDMHGNAREWVADCWATSYADIPRDGVPFESADCKFRVYRGGSWFSIAASLRAADRVRDTPSFHNNGVGFRIARSAN